MSTTSDFIFGIFSLIICLIFIYAFSSFRKEFEKYEEEKEDLEEYVGIFLSKLYVSAPRLYNQVQLWEKLYHLGKITKEEYLNNINKTANYYPQWRKIEEESKKEFILKKKTKEILENGTSILKEFYDIV